MLHKAVLCDPLRERILSAKLWPAIARDTGCCAMRSSVMPDAVLCDHLRERILTAKLWPATTREIGYSAQGCAVIA